MTVGAVDFVLVQLGQSRQPVADRLAQLGTREARFGELFNGGELEAALDEHIEFFDGMPIFTVLPVVAAIVDDLMPASRLRPGRWPRSSIRCCRRIQAWRSLLPSTAPAGLVVNWCRRTGSTATGSTSASRESPVIRPCSGGRRCSPISMMRAPPGGRRR